MKYVDKLNNTLSYIEYEEILMTNSFAQLKKSRSSQFEKLANAVEKASSNTQQKSSGDDRFWKPTIDKAGNGSAIIRFLPAPPGEDVPFARYWDHGFQGPGGWYIEKSLTTLGQDDPVSEYNSKLWNSGIEANKEIARKQKRRLHHVSNILVVSDPGNPDNEGKVFLYEYGKKIFDKLNDMMHPQFDDEDPINPFDMWEGANFRLRIRNVEGYRNYDKSAFDSPSAISNDDEELESIWNTQHSLTEFTDPSNFKSYADLQQRLAKVLGETSPNTTAETETADDVQAAWTPPAETAPEPAVAESPSDNVVNFEDEDESLDFFKKLANE